MENKLYDLIIIGAGPAGMAAAIYAGRANKSVIIIDKDGFGGNIAKSPKVENIPGFISISGVDFATNMYEQITNLENIEHIVGNVIFVNYKRGVFVVSLEDKTTFCSKSIIFATGTKPKEIKLDTKDLYYCCTCDGPFFKKKSVIIIGSGNTGATYALELATYCKHVYICDITMDIMCEPILAKRIREKENITFLPNCTIKSVKNDKEGNLSSIILTTSEEIEVKAIFSALGMIPQTDIAKQYLNIDEKHYLGISLVPGAFAAGDCTQEKVKQVTTACASGTKAALDAIKYLNSMK